MQWLTGEPTIDDVMSDPTILALMERDEVDPDDLRGFLEDVKVALEGLPAIPLQRQCRLAVALLAPAVPRRGPVAYSQEACATVSHHRASHRPDPRPCGIMDTRAAA